MLKKYPFLILALMLMALNGCMMPQPPISIIDSGRSIPVRKGQRLDITLSGNPQTGAKWEIVEADPSIIRLMHPPKRQMKALGMGLASIYDNQYTFEIVRAVEGRLYLEYRQQESGEVLDSFELFFSPGKE